jgi:hypothetical protein
VITLRDRLVADQQAEDGTIKTIGFEVAQLVQLAVDQGGGGGGGLGAGGLTFAVNNAGRLTVTSGSVVQDLGLVVGAAGSSLYVGGTAPVQSLGKDGDTYIDTVTGYIYLKAAGAWSKQPGGLAGPAGTAGQRGAQISAGNGTPTAPGQVNDLYLDAATGNLWGYGGTSWSNTGYSLRGATGAQFISGTAAPTTQGNVGDTYIDLVTGNVYQKGSGGWTSTGYSLKGPAGSGGGSGGTAGASFLSGTGSPAGSLGATGDTYIDLATGNTYQKGGGGWTATGLSLRGLAGAAGTAGGTGAPGISFLSGSGVPASGTGANGDSYVDLATGTVYAKSGGAWSSTGQSLRGPAGTAGAVGAPGAAGTAGASFLSGSGAPASGYGITGDGYLDVVSGLVYLKGGGGWASTGQSLKTTNIPIIYPESPLADATTIAINSTVVLNNAYLALTSTLGASTRQLGLPTGLTLPLLPDGTVAPACVYPLTIVVKQPSGGGQLLTFPAGVTVVGNLDTAANAFSVVTVLYRFDGTTVTGRAVITRGFA